MSETVPDFRERPEKMPVLFIGHGSPMNAIEDNAFSQAWKVMAATLPRPQAFLCVSAHWQTQGTAVAAMERPHTIHDFYGFPPELFAVQYPCPGSPSLARLVAQTAEPRPVQQDMAWGLDHGAWSVLCRLCPQADVPVVQLSLDYASTPEQHYALGRALRPLRRRGVLIVGSGNIVHNLRVMRWQETAYDWAAESDALVTERIAARQHDDLVHYERLGPSARLAIPTNEHYLPLLYVLAAQEDDDCLAFFAERVTLGSISMRSLRIG